MAGTKGSAQSDAVRPRVRIDAANPDAAAVRVLRTGLARAASRPAARADAGDHILNPHLAPNPNAAPARHAAVLIAIGSEAGSPALILTERAAHLPHHAGQISFPGGRIETGETAIEAALREAEEEVALPRDAVEVIGTTGEYLTRTGFLVFPVVALLRRAVALSPDPNEVAVAFTTPWDYVMDRANHRKVVINGGGSRREYFEIRHGARRIWGVTAGILRLVEGTIRTP